MSLGGPTAIADVDLPAPDGEIRWANFSNIGTGTLCVFWARDGLITRHDCITALGDHGLGEPDRDQDAPRD